MIYLVRHGQTDWNKQGRVQGVQDIPLNMNGIKQAMDNRDLYKGHHFTHVFTSPLQRAEKTAKIITSKAKVDHFEVADELIEYDFGLRDGTTIEEDARELEANSRRAHPVDYHEEDEEHFVKRIAKILIEAGMKEGNVMLVTHGAVISTILQMLLPKNQDQYIFLENNSVCCIDNKMTEDGNLVLTFNGANINPEELEKLLSEND